MQKTFLPLVILLATMSCFGQSKSEFEQFLKKSFVEIPPSFNIYSWEKRDTLAKLSNRTDAYYSPTIPECDALKFIYEKGSTLNDSAIFHQGLTYFQCGKNIITTFEIICALCNGTFGEGTCEIWMISYSPEGKIIDRARLGMIDDRGTFAAEFFPSTSNSSPILLSIYGRQSIYRNVEWDNKTQKERIEGDVAYYVYDIDQDGHFTYREERRTQARFSYQDTQNPLSIIEEW